MADSYPAVGGEQEEEAGMEVLPLEILDRIQACLPTVQYFRSRLVCKRWRDNLRVAALREMHAEIALQEQWILTFPYHHKVDNRKKLPPCYAHHPLSYKWHPIPVPPVAPRPLLDIVGVANGLICFQEAADSEADHCSIVVVCSPLEGTRTLVPPFQQEGDQECDLLVVGFDVCRKTGGYRVFAGCVGSDGGGRDTLVMFDSRDGSWAVVGSWVRNRSSYHFLWSVVCGSWLYLLRYALDERHERIYSLVANKLDGGEWEELDVEMPEELSCACPYLINYQGRLLMLGATPWNYQEQASSKIWELDTRRSQLVEIATAPSPFNGHLYPYSCFVGIDNLLYMQLNCSNQRMLACDLSCSPPSWRILPPGPLFRNSWFSMPVVPGLNFFTT